MDLTNLSDSNRDLKGGDYISDEIKSIANVVISALSDAKDIYKSADSLSKDTGIPQNSIKYILESDERVKKIFSTKLNEEVYTLKKNNKFEEFWKEIRQLSYFKLGGGA
jgi:hypothetical protein